MQHFSVSQGLTEKLPELIVPTFSRNATVELYWFGHIVPTVGGDYAVFMEDSSRYCLVMHQPPQHSHEFRRAFFKLLHQSVRWLTQVNAKTAKRVELSIADVCRDLSFSVGLDYSVSADLFDIACQLQLFLEQSSSIPGSSQAEHDLAQHLNYTTRINSQSQEVLPVESFKLYWCRTLGISPQELHTSLS